MHVELKEVIFLIVFALFLFSFMIPSMLKALKRIIIKMFKSDR